MHPSTAIFILLNWTQYCGRVFFLMTFFTILAF
ncbi:hypothetical protein F383_38478 [Gossypium arboreum]|uniref:Uncharacterized protein n=1 Tax=Gossypium arboreum TaxID=29729 RepID=A0A0B0MKX4_GOSAR|nr:hypothetical protein F383_38478 [Gossypium arboreum]